MNKIIKYNDFLLEKEFNSIIECILMMNEDNTYEWDLTDNKNNIKPGNTISWDFTSNENPSNEFEWDIEQQGKNIKDYIKTLKTGASKIKNKLSKFRDYLNKGEEDLNIDMNSILFNKIKDFIKKLNTKEEIKKYYNKLIDELKDLPYNIKKDLFVKLSILILSLSSLPIGDLITDKDITKNSILGDVKKEVINNKEKKSNIIKNDVTTKDVSVKTSSFEEANKLVSFAEGGYTDNPVDAGNYTSGPFSKSGYLIGTNHGIAAFTLLKTDIKPTSDIELKALKQCYGSRYNELCGNDVPSFSEQWKLDQKYIKPRDIGTKWKNVMKSLQKETAQKIYESEYWKPQGFSNIKSQSIANILYDACVNQGPGIAKKVFVRSMDRLGHDADGVKGWQDVHKKLTPIVNSMDNKDLKELHDEIKDQRMQQYKSNADANEIEEFSKGWENRLAKEINTFDGGDIS